ncbi:MAG: flagellar hook protein FlgE [bacterium]|nr:flagellar hook protein FlgE [bacterium]
MSLLSALYTGVSGLQTFGDSLQVIGDNIANVNTTAFKSSRAEFADLLSQTINGASGRSQLGRGVTLDRISANFSQGSFSNTDRLTDLAINGNGFFIVTDGSRQYYTRNGQLTLNNQGEIVTTSGMQLVGYQYDASGQPLGSLGTLKISQTSTQPHMTGDGSTAGSGVQIHLNLNASSDVMNNFSVSDPSATSNFSTSMTVYDSLGQDHAVQIYFNKTADNTWGWHALVDGGELAGGTSGVPTEAATGTLVYNSSGALKTSTTTQSSFNFTGTAQTIGFDFGDSIDAGGTGLSGSTQFSSPSVVNSQSQDGFAAGNLQSVTVDEDGIISGIYSNGQTLPIGQIALANFTNLQGLFKSGSGLYSDTSDSGVPIVSQPNVGGFGTISAYSLELSNVDLATEFVSLISNQRAYQANSKIITVGDQLMSDVLNIIR